MKKHQAYLHLVEGDKHKHTVHIASNNTDRFLAGFEDSLQKLRAEARDKDNYLIIDCDAENRYIRVRY